MKKIRFIIFATVAMIMATSFTAEAQNKKAEKREVQVTLSVPDLDCPNCVKKIEAKIPHEKGVKDLKVSLENRTVWISFEENKTNVETLSRALDKLGFPVKTTEKKD